ncbi:MAG: nucleoid-associated protein [Oscillospiraceae bacterium]|nr:nucleoid-associated protein [Oscillospiraceae bacterium]
MLQVTRAILHILDTSSGVTVFSDAELPLEDAAVYEYLIRHLEKLRARHEAKQGEFHPGSAFQEKWKTYLRKELSFRDFSAFIAEAAARAEEDCDKAVSFDLLICEFAEDGVQNLAVLKCDNKTGYTHQVENIDGAVCNKIINQYAILPSPGQRIAEYAFVSEKNEILLEDKKSFFNGEEKSLLADHILQCETEMSGKETIALVERITQAVAESFGEAPVAAAAKAKSYLAEESGRQLDQAESIADECPFVLNPEELSREIFSESEDMQKEFIEKVKEAGLSNKVPLQPKLVAKQVKNQRIKTDTGIELIFPVEFFKNGDYIEFIDLPDGTMNIQLKHIGYIQNK